MIYSSENNIDFEICKPSSNYDRIKELLQKLSDESDNMPFTSEDFGIDEKGIENFINYLNSSDNSIFLIVKIQDNPAGFAYLEGGKRARTYHCANLGIGVLEEFHGNGIGSFLMESLLEFAFSTPYIAKIDLQVRKDNISAIKLYKKYKFEVEGVCKRALYINNQFHDYLCMGRLID